MEYMMKNLDKYDQVFMDYLSIEKAELSELSYQSKSSWDSVGHMALISELEEVFEIMMDTDDIIDFSSYEKGKEILRKYDVRI